MANHTGLSMNGQGLGGQNQGQNGSQEHVPAVHANAQPGSSTGQLPNVDLSFLANYPPDQIAAIGQLFLSGAMRLPPSITAQQSEIETRQSQSDVPQAQTIVQTEELQQQQDQVPDLEEGEISDVSASGDPVLTSSHPESLAHTQASNAPRRRRSHSPIDLPPSKRSLSPAFYAHQQQQLEGFIRVMYDNGYGFDHVKNHVSDHDELTALYQRLSLPTTSKQAQPQPVITQTSVTSGAPPTETKQLMSKATLSAASAKLPSNASAPQDRQAYLARLQAAKSKKSESMSIPSAGTRTASAATTSKSRAAADHQTAAKPVKKGLDAEKKELLRQRLAALKAAQASKEQAAQDKAAAVVQDVDQFLSTLTHDSGGSQQGSLTSPPSDSQIASPPQPRLPFDSDASRYQSLVISVSDNEPSESELDDSSIDADDGGVTLESTVNGTDISASQVYSTADFQKPSSNSEASGASTPGDLAAKTIQDLGELKRRLAEAEARKKARTNGQLQQKESGTSDLEPITTTRAAQGLTTVVDELASDTPVAVTDTARSTSAMSGLDSLAVPASHDPVLTAFEYHPVDADSDVDMDSSDFEAMYEAPETKVAAPASPAMHLQTDVDDEDSDWIGTGSEAEDEGNVVKQTPVTAPEASSNFQLTSDHQAIPSPSPTHSQDADSASDSCSMEISDASADEHSIKMSSTEEHVPAESIHEHKTVASLYQPANIVAVPEVDDLAADNQISIPHATSFSPYESPLRALKRYRFHPHLVKLIAEPWKSLTWTHKGEPMDVVQPVENKQVCKEHDRLGYHVHWEELLLQGIEYLADLAWNPGWTDSERDEWSTAMALAAQEQAQFRDLDHDTLVTRSEHIMVKHALAWSKQSLMRSCQELT